MRLARRAIEEWQRLDAGLLQNTGLLEYGSGIELHAAAMDACGEEYQWLEAGEAGMLFPEAHFPEPVLYDHMARRRHGGRRAAPAGGGRRRARGPARGRSA